MGELKTKHYQKYHLKKKQAEMQNPHTVTSKLITNLKDIKELFLVVKWSKRVHKHVTSLKDNTNQELMLSRLVMYV